MKTLLITQKELTAYFLSPAAFIFMGGFVFINLLIFFWLETFFARNIADVRPLFEWMPVLLIFLCSAITMRAWSEERRTGTLELLLTSPTTSFQLVLGKFWACFSLLSLALLLTLPLPITVSLIGPLDWGPVIGGYLATLFLAAAYSAIGLFISSRSDNPLVSLMLTILVCSVFYLLGSEQVVSLLASTPATSWLQLLSTGSRFESITRGVLDVRDIYYYLSVVGVFLSLNIYSLEKLRWTKYAGRGTQRTWRWLTSLLVANFFLGNIWLYQFNHLRVDMTQDKVYSISNATHGYIQQLQEPLLIRGYFSAQTHPLLAPLMPQLQDLMREYAVVGQGKIRVEFIDPLENSALEKEAGEKYGIQPVAFQTADKYQAALVNSYFDILVQYGDQYQVLNFRDLIDVKMLSETDVEVQLRNPEYDITRAIKHVLYAYQSAGDLFLNITKPVTFSAYISENKHLPEQLQVLRQDIESMFADLSRASKGRLKTEIIAPEAGNGAMAEYLKTSYGFRPMTASLHDPNTFWFYLVLSDGKQTIQVPLPEDLSAAGVKRGVEAALKRFSSGFLKTVALFTPKAQPSVPMLGMQALGLRYSQLREHLRQNFLVLETDLDSGQVPDKADLLIVIAPENLSDKQLFAIDQFLMQGGTVVLASSPFQLSSQEGLEIVDYDSGLSNWLTHHGLTIESKLVLDMQNTPFPIPVQRDVGGFAVQELHMIDYPYFIDVRKEGLDSETGILAGISQLTLNWASPITLDTQSTSRYQVHPLLHSSEEAWLSKELNVQPDFSRYDTLGFPVDKSSQGRKLLAVVIAGSFKSFFQSKPSPLMMEEVKGDNDTTFTVSRVIEKSPESARIILFASNSFLSDDVINLASSAFGSFYANGLQVMMNTVDWSLEESGLLAIRARDHFSRTLDSLSKHQQQFLEYTNYGIALLGLGVLYGIFYIFRLRTSANDRRLLQKRG